ncbi:MAG: lipopolysaccharide biosynthesis protein [Steroidobacteraceae bacterium]
MQHEELDRSLFRGIAWTAVFRWATQLVSWVATLYAVRRLDPGDYGLVAMAMVPVGLVRMVEDFGFESVLVQDRSLTTAETARLAGLLLLAGAAIALLLGLASVPVAHFFSEPGVVALVCALAPLIVLDAAQVLPRARLQIDLHYGTLAAIGALQGCVTAATLATCAWLGLGHWALVLNTLAGAVAATLALLWLRPYRPARPAGLRALLRPILAGWRVLVSRAGWYTYTNADQAVIGRLLGKEVLGTYSFALTFSTLPIQEVTSVVSKVVPGVFSAVQRSPESLRRYFLMLTELVAYLAFPAAAGLALVADSLIHVVLGTKWVAAIEPLRILCLYAAGYAAQLLSSHVLMWTGQFRANMWLTLLSAAGLPLAFWLGASQGVAGVAWAWAIAFPLFSLPGLIMALRTAKTPFAAFLGALAPAASGCLVMGAAVELLRRFGPFAFDSLAGLSAQILVGVVVYAASMWLLYAARLRTLAGAMRGLRAATS